MAREAHAEGARRKLRVEEKQPSSFPSLPGPKAVQSFLVLSNQINTNLAKSRILGFLLRNNTIKSIFFSKLYEYKDRSIHLSYPISIWISKKESISFNV